LAFPGKDVRQKHLAKNFVRGEDFNEVEAAWVIEAERRYQEYRKGKRQPIPADKVFAEADRLLERTYQEV